jgi:hypothetical protein
MIFRPEYKPVDGVEVAAVYGLLEDHENIGLY